MDFFSIINHASAQAVVETEFGQAHTVADFVNKAIPKILGVLGGAAFLVIIFAGYIYMTSQGDQSKIGLAKELIIGVITGILLLFLIAALRGTIGF